MSEPRLDLDRLLKLRLVVARFGEMDHACWWNTKGQLGRLGAARQARRRQGCKADAKRAESPGDVSLAAGRRAC